MPEVWPDAVKGIIDTFQQTDIPQLDVRNNLSCLNPYLYSNNVFIKLLPNVKKTVTHTAAVFLVLRYLAQLGSVRT